MKRLIAAAFAFLIVCGTANAAYKESAPNTTAPTVTVLTSGTAATYTVPAGAVWLKVTEIGGGGAGATAGASVGSPTNGGNTTFNSVVANGATSASATTPGSGGTSGTGSATIRIPGQTGGYGYNAGTSFFPGNTPGSPAVAGTTNTTGGFYQ